MWLTSQGAQGKHLEGARKGCKTVKAGVLAHWPTKNPHFFPDVQASPEVTHVAIPQMAFLANFKLRSFFSMTALIKR